ncbi:hypothetical protein [Staphylococcus nepalensis]
MYICEPFRMNMRLTIVDRNKNELTPSLKSTTFKAPYLMNN